jgi:hypothetical protein
MFGEKAEPKPVAITMALRHCGDMWGECAVCVGYCFFRLRRVLDLPCPFDTLGKV